MPVFPGQLRYIRKNIFHAVYVLDPASICGLEVMLLVSKVGHSNKLLNYFLIVRFGLQFIHNRSYFDLMSVLSACRLLYCFIEKDKKYNLTTYDVTMFNTQVV